LTYSMDFVPLDLCISDFIWVCVVPPQWHLNISIADRFGQCCSRDLYQRQRGRGHFCSCLSLLELSMNTSNWLARGVCGCYSDGIFLCVLFPVGGSRKPVCRRDCCCCNCCCCQALSHVDPGPGKKESHRPEERDREKARKRKNKRLPPKKGMPVARLAGG
jgi:hypothetical protein